MKAYVIDENVPIVANDGVRAVVKAPQADEACRLCCIRMLKRIVKSGLVIIDTGGEVLEGYSAHLQHRGQPGVGDAFFKHIIDHQFNYKRIRRIEVARHAERGFEMFPADPELAPFDPSDRIYVALALVAPEKPCILNAVDSDYAEYEAALKRAGVRVEELCAHCIRKIRRGGRQRDGQR